MVNKRFNFLNSCVACLAAFEAGALVVCLAIMVLDSGASSIFEGVALWIMSQPLVLFFALGAMPITAFLRIFLGLNFENPRRVAMIAGTVFGLVLAALFAGVFGAHEDELVYILPVGAIAGLAGGWVWWLFEKDWLMAEDAP